MLKFVMNRLAKRWIDWIEDRPQHIPNWVAAVIERDPAVRGHFEELQRLRERLNDDREAWLRTIARPRPLPVQQNSERPVVSETSRDIPTSLHHRTTQHPRTAQHHRTTQGFGWALGLVAIAITVCFWPRNAEDAVQQSEQAVAYSTSSNLHSTGGMSTSENVKLEQSADWRSLVATMHAGQKVSARITASTAELVAKSRTLSSEWLDEGTVRESLLPGQIWPGRTKIKTALGPLQLLVNLD